MFPFMGVPYHHAAALLDPKAYDYRYRVGTLGVVPPNTVWYALNLWFVKINGHGPYFHRRLNIQHAMPLTPGTEIASHGRAGFAYICKPETVSYADPEATYKDRMEILPQLPQFSVKVRVRAGSLVGQYDGASWDRDMDALMLNSVSINNLCWVIVVGNHESGNDAMSAMNTLEEIDDQRAQRFTGNVLCPLKRSLWNGIWGQAGFDVVGKPGSLGGEGIAIYQKLPTFW